MIPLRRLSALVLALALAAGVSACAAPNDSTWIHADRRPAVIDADVDVVAPPVATE